MSKLTDNQLSELCVLTTRDEAGRHFTQWSEHYGALEEMGLITINRPVHAATGLNYDCSHWTVELTEEGLVVVEDNPELHASQGELVEEIGDGFYEAADGTVIYSPEV